MDILLFGWRWCKWNIINWLCQPIWGLHGQPTVNFFHLVGLSVSAKQLKDIIYIPWGGRNQDLAQGCTIVSFDSIPSLISNCLKSPLELREGFGDWIKPISCNPEMQDPRRRCVQEPHRVLLGVVTCCNKSFLLPLFDLFMDIDSTCTKRWTQFSGDKSM